MGKRASNQAAASPKRSRRTKVDPVLVSIGDVVKQSEHLPERVRAMLVDMLPFSLGIPSDERHEFQTWVVDAVEQTMSTKKSKLEAAAAAASADLEKLKASGAVLDSTSQEAERSHEAQIETERSAEVALAAASEATSAATKGLSTARAEQKTGDAKLASSQEEKSELESALKEHLEAPMQEGSGPNYKSLKHSLGHLDMDDALRGALPSSCAKAKDDRGSFDEVVLQEFAKAFNTKITSLTAFVATDTIASGERAAAVTAAEKDLEVKTEAQRQCAEALEAAKKELSDKAEALKQARAAVVEYDPKLGALAGHVDDSNETVADFESGPLSNFMTYKSRVAVSAVAATSGA